MRYTLQIRQGTDPGFALLKPIVIQGIKIKQKKDKIEFNYKAFDKNGFLDGYHNGYDKAFNLRNALVMIFGVSLTPLWGAPVTRNKSDPMYHSVRDVKRMMKTTGTSSAVLLEPHHVKRISEYLDALHSIDTEITGKVYEGISWYNRGLDEKDPTQKFILFYITLEFLGTYFNPIRNSTAKVRAVLNKYSNNAAITEQILACRHEIFHQGAQKYDISSYTHAMNSAINGAFRDIVFKKIPPKKASDGK